MTLLQFVFGVFIGSIIGIFVMSIVSVSKVGEQDTPNEKGNSTEMDADV